MRITGGDLRGRILQVPTTELVRPTQDRVREALFNMLGRTVPGSRWLDLFSGTGAVAAEALSRGAASAVCVELEARHITAMKRNFSALGLDAKTEIVRTDVYKYLTSPAASRAFDVVFADPPYELGAEKGYAEVQRILAENRVLRPEGLFITEMKSRQQAEDTALWTVLRDRTYGQTRLVIYQLNPTQGGPDNGRL